MQGTTAGAQDPAVDCHKRDKAGCVGRGKRFHPRPAACPRLPPKIRPMAGHSKWAQIKHKKAATDAKRGKQFTKLARAITVAAREGGGDPDGNPTLATAIQKARDYSMPKDNIQRAIDRGTGEGGAGGEIERAVYEGYGPGGAAILIEALTDNRNRTGADVRHAFDKHGGSLGEPGSVAWIFENRGVVLVDADRYSEDDLIPAIDAGADDVSEDGDLLKVVSGASQLAAVREALEAGGVEIESAELTMEPKSVVEIGGEDAPRLVRLMEALDEQDDVDAVHANFDIPAEVLESVAA
jgi:YebC/PmpR family DNA-binding regulatory protein